MEQPRSIEPRLSKFDALMAVHGQDLTARRMRLCEVRDGRITEAIGYCSGEWDEELRARHAAETPMIRP